MAMNYIGSISILDRGDAPAQAVIDRNARSLAQRMSDETKDELQKVMTRVHNIYSNMDTVDEVYMGGPSMEYLNDLAELEEILKDEIKKRQYQQQVTVFIVGYSDVCHQKLRLLQQVNEFFMENTKLIDEEDWFPTTPDMDLEEISNNVEDSLAHAHALTNRLGELNREMVDYVAALAEKKASSKGKKKIEKALNQAKEEVSGLSEKLLALQKDLEDKEEKVQNLFKQLDTKTMEANKYKTAAELGKQAADDMELLQKEISTRDAKILAQRTQLSHLEVELAQSNHLKERTETKFSQSDSERQQKINMIQKQLDDETKAHEETKSELTKLLDDQVNAMHASYREEVDDLNKAHDEEIKTLQEELAALRKELSQSQHELMTLRIEQNTDTPSEAPRYLDLDSEASQQASRQSSKQESRPSTKDTRASGASKAGGGARSKPGGRSPTRSKDGKSASKSSAGRSACSRSRENSFASLKKDGDKEFAEIAVQDEGGDPTSATVDEKARTPATRLGKRSKSNLAPVLESDLDSAFDLFDDQAWASVPKDEVSGRFAQFRRLSTNKLQELEDQLNLVTAKTRRKVATLKAQFQEHKGKWETERKVLIEQVDQSIKLQGDAEKEADAAMTQLEDFITEQERLEQEEEHHRSEVLQASASLTPHSNVTPAQGRSAAHTPTAGTPDPEGELQRLMQQTDDAKSARQGESCPASAVTRSSSGGSVLMGKGLLDITKPFKEPSPSPDKPSGENTSAPTPTLTKANKKSPTPEGAELHAEVTIVPAPMEVSEETLNEVGLRITPENGHVAPLLVGTPREEKAVEGVVGASGQPLPPHSDTSEDDRPAPVVLLMMPERGGPHQEQQEAVPQVESDGSVHVQALIPPGLANVSSSDRDPSTVLDVKVIPQREAEALEEGQKEREPTSSSFASKGESSFVIDNAPGGDTQGPPIVQLQPVSPRGDTFSSPRVTREAIAAPRRSVSELSAPVFARLDLLALMKGRARSAMVAKQARKPASVPTVAAKIQESQPKGLQREGTVVSVQSEGVAPFTGRTPLGLDGIDIDVTTPRNVQQVQEMNARMSTTESAPAAPVEPEASTASAPTTAAEVAAPKAATIPEAAVLTEAATEGAAPSTKAAAEEAAPAPKVAAEEAAPASEASAEVKQAVSPQPVDKQAVETKSRPTTVVAQTTTLRFSAQDHALSRSGTPFALKITNRSTGEVHVLTDVIQGTVAPFSTPVPQHFADQREGNDLQPIGKANGDSLATTFINPEGRLIVMEPTSVKEAATQGLTAVEILSDPTVTNLSGSRAASGTERGRVGSATEAGVVGFGSTTTPRRSPIETPTRQVSFGASLGTVGMETAPTLSPRSSTLSSSKFVPRRSKSSTDLHHLSVVMEGGSPPKEQIGAQLGEAKESALEMLKSMMSSEEQNLKPKQIQALESMRAAVKASVRLRGSASGKKEATLTEEKSERTKDALSPISSCSTPSSGSAGKEKKTRKRTPSLPEEELVARTLTVTALACQMAHEAFRLGVRPDSIFRTFSHMTPAAMLDMVDPSSVGNVTSGGAVATGAHPVGKDGRDTASAKARREGLVTRETTLASVQEVDSEVPEEETKVEAQVDLSELRELPILDIADAVPSEVMKPASGQILPSEATRGSSILDPLETPMAELIEGGQHIRLDEEGKMSKGQGELMDDGSTLEKAQTHISEREATQGGSGSPAGGDNALLSRDQTTVSKQATQGSMAGGQKSFLGQSVTSLDGGKVEGVTEEDIRASSAHSRASLREQYKAKLEEAKMAAEDRRSKSPAIHLPTQMTVDDELIVDDEDDDDYFLEEGEMPIPDDMKEGLLDYRDPSMYEVGTSPPPGMKGSRDPSQLSKDNTRISKGPYREPTGPYRDPSKPGRDPTQPLIQKIFRKGTSLLEHPLLKEYLKTYDAVVGFKEGMSKMFLDKDMMSAHQMTSDLETLTFDHGQKVMPQIEELTHNVAYVLEELVNLTNNILVYDREPPVSSLHLLSREPTQRSFHPVGDSALSFTNPLPVAPPATIQDVPRGGSQASSHRSEGVKGEVKGRLSIDMAADKSKLVDLENQYSQLKQQLDDNGKQHQDQLQRNTVVMMEMQDTINELQRELSALGKTAKQSKSRLSSARGSAVHHKSPSPETSVMFTRLDSERNAKIMKKAVMDDKLNTEKYKEAVAKMDEYVSLPAQRLAHLVRKFMHHTRMRAIEEKVKNSSSVNEEVFEVLDKMEDLQNRRARQWADRMDEMGIERLKLANLLMDTLDNIEQESGIFLIKPMYSYKGRDVKPGAHPGKLSRPVRTQHRIGTGNPRHHTPTNDGASSFVPAPTPASNYRLVRHERHFLQQQQQQQQQVPATMAEMRPVETRASKDDGQVKIMGNGMTFAAGSPRTTWNMQASQPWFGKDDPANQFNTPRILELDVNRMLIGQNNISSKVPFPLTEDRLMNANNNTLRSYVTVNRPTAPLATGERPSSSGSTKSSGRRPKVSQIDKEIPEALPIPHPLPPISSMSGEEEGEEESKEGVRPPSVAFSDEYGNDEEEEDEENENTEPPHSPPGSSLYHSVVTKNEEEEDDDNKEDTTLTQE